MAEPFKAKPRHLQAVLPQEPAPPLGRSSPGFALNPGMGRRTNEPLFTPANDEETKSLRIQDDPVEVTSGRVNPLPLDYMAPKPRSRADLVLDSAYDAWLLNKGVTGSQADTARWLLRETLKIVEDGKTRPLRIISDLSALPPGLKLPSVKYNESSECGKGKLHGIIRFLRSEAWQEFFGDDIAITMGVMRQIDNSAWMALRTFFKKYELPEDIRVLREDDFLRIAKLGAVPATTTGPAN